MGEKPSWVRFGELYAGPSRNGVNYPTRLRGSGTPMVNMREIFAFDFIGDQEMELVPLTEREERECLLGRGDLLFARQSLVREGAGRVVYVRDGPPRTWEGHLIRVRLDETQAESKYFYYFFRSPAGRSSIDAIVEQVAAAGIRGSDLAGIKVPLPPLPEQRAIAEVLGALDDKIEANRELAERAWELAVSWGIAQVNSVPGTLVRLEEVADITKGVSYRSDDLRSGGGWLVSLKCVGQDGMFRQEGLKPFVGVAKAAQMVREGDVLVAQTDLTQRAAVIGRAVIVEAFGRTEPFAASLDFVVVQPRRGLSREVLFAVLSQQDFRNHSLGFCNGTTVLHMGALALPTFTFVLPPADVIGSTTALMNTLFARTRAARRENMALAGLRDDLLPKLLLGELRVRDAESLVEDAV